MGSTKKILERFSLAGKTALVTGGGQGIGKGFCLALGEAGAKVAVVDLDEAHANEVAAELKEKSIDAIAIQADVTKPEETEKMVETIIKKWGTLTIAVNNAGIGMWRDAESMEYSDWLRVHDINLNGVYLCAKAEGRAMLKANYGKIINTASMSAHIVNTPQHQCAYNSSKAAVLHLTRSLAAEWAEKGIRVNSISPGYTKTILVEKLLETPEGNAMLPTWIERTPMRRLAVPEDIQGALIYLASEASDFVTGSDIVVDGGYCCW